MTDITKLVAVGAAVLGVAAVQVTFAQDDLDALLKDLEAETVAAEKKSTPAAAEAPAEAAKPEAPATEAPAEAVKPEAPAVEAVAEQKAEAPAEEAVKPEAPAVEAVAEQKAEAPAEEVAAKPAKTVSPDAELIASLATTEKLRRTALDAQASREIAEARRCMEDGEFTEAVRHYGDARRLLNDSEASKAFRRECDQGVAQGLYRAALQEDEVGRRDRALKLMEKAVDMRHPKARRVLEKWVNEGKTVVEKKDISEIAHRKNEGDYKSERDQIRRHLRRSRQYLSVRDMERALEEVEIVLVNDPYNQEAIRLRGAIERKRQTILRQERKSSRDGMIADVDEAWRPVYAVNAAQLNETTAETIKSQTGDDPERTQEQEIEARMKAMRLPTISFKPPATIIDAVEFFRQASKDYDRPDIPVEKRGFNFVLRTPQGALKSQPAAEESDDFSAQATDESAAPANGLEPIQTITASDITFYEALKLVCGSVRYKFIVRGPVVMVMPSDMSTEELLSRKYNVPEAFVERVNSAKDEMKEMGGFGNSSQASRKSDDSEEDPTQDWKVFFGEMGVKWPEGSSIKHIKALGKLYVRNTRENLAEFEKVLDELGGQPQLIEIETRFVEVSQEDLNSLGFEWILNSDYSINLDSKISKALGISNGNTKGVGADGSLVSLGPSGIPASTASGTTQNSGGNPFAGDSPTVLQSAETDRSIGIKAIDGVEYQNGNRFLSTKGNHISGEANSNNDQFMRVNAFLGNADLSMILHMLAQRNDTDLLSAPKVVTKSGENAVIKVVTEYIYPTDYDVQLQSSGGSSSSSSSGGGSSAILAVVEPQNFTMREVGVILDVIPTYSEANGGTIELELKPQVVDEPTWMNYGMKIPFSGNTSLQNFAGIGEIFTGLSSALDSIGATLTEQTKNAMALAATDSATKALENVSKSGSDTMTWYDAPMNQPFFHVRSIDSKVSITPGSTVVMGGLITEQRKAMDDKIPFLGDLPFVGRLFRSHAEQTIKRNLLIFVTGRLITPSGRELKVNAIQTDDAEVEPAPAAE